MYYIISTFKTACSDYSNSNISSVSKYKHLDLNRVWDFYIIRIKSLINLYIKFILAI